MPEPSAELLRRAAAKIRHVANAATYGPWIHNADDDAQVTFPGRSNSRENLHPRTVASQGFDGGINSPADVDHIAMWHPGVAVLVAAWLEQSAFTWDASQEAATGPMKGVELASWFQHETDVAHAILGESA